MTAPRIFLTDELLKRALAERAEGSSDDLLWQIISSAEATSQPRRWSARLRPGPRQLVLLGAILLLLAALAGAVAVGSGLLRQPAPERSLLDPGRWIAYQTCTNCDGSDEQVWLVRGDGTSSHRLSSLPGIARAPAISPDGTQVAFGHLVSIDAPSQVYVAGIDGSNPHPVLTCIPPACLGYDEPAWSPNGTKLAIYTDFGPPQHNVPIANGIAVVDVASGRLTQLVRHDGPTGQDWRPRWSPDGRFVVFWRARAGSDGSNQTAIFVVGSDGTDLRQLTPWAEDAGDPDWSPDGSTIVYSTHPLDAQWATLAVESELVTIRPDGSGRKVLTHFGLIGPRATQPRWTPNGRAVVYTRVTDKDRHIWVISADGVTNEPVLTQKVLYTNPALQP